MKAVKNAKFFSTYQILSFEVWWVGSKLSDFESESSIRWKRFGSFTSLYLAYRTKRLFYLRCKTLFFSNKKSVRGAQVGKISLLDVNLLRRKCRRWAYSFFISYASGPGIPPKPSILEEDVAFVLTMRSQNSETITFQAAVRCCVTATLASETFWQHRQTCT